MERYEKEKLKQDLHDFKESIVTGDGDTISRLLAEKVAKAKEGRTGT